MGIRKSYSEAIKKLLQKLSAGEKADVTNSMIKVAHAADIAELIANLSEERQLKVFQALDDKRKGDVFVELPEDVQADVVQDSDKELLFKLFEELEPDEKVDLLNLLNKEQQEHLLNLLPKNKEKRLRHLLGYSEESAGGLMTPVLIAITPKQTVADAIDLIRQRNYEERILDIYVIDKAEKLLGLVSLQKLVIADGQMQIDQIMEHHPITVNVHDDQEVIAQKVDKYNLFDVPVVDDEGYLQGRITIDDVIAVAHEEANEDVYLMAGMDAEEVFVESGLQVARMRLPWILMCLAGSFVSALVLHFYEETLTTYITLIAFLPAICAMGGNSGLQASTVTIRNLTYGAVFYKNFKKVMQRELLSGLTIGLVCGLVVGTIGMIWLKGFIFGVAIGISMLLTILLSTCSGFFVPIVFNKLKIDPAISSGPLITTLNDAMSALIYLSLATFLLHFLG